MVGKTEAQLTRAGVCYEVGVADYREVNTTINVFRERSRSQYCVLLRATLSETNFSFVK